MLPYAFIIHENLIRLNQSHAARVDVAPEVAVPHLDRCTLLELRLHRAPNVVVTIAYLSHNSRLHHEGPMSRHVHGVIVGQSESPGLLYLLQCELSAHCKPSHFWAHNASWRSYIISDHTPGVKSPALSEHDAAHVWHTPVAPRTHPTSAVALLWSWAAAPSPQTSGPASNHLLPRAYPAGSNRPT